jgi:putative endopeptidase
VKSFVNVRTIPAVCMLLLGLAAAVPARAQSQEPVLPYSPSLDVSSMDRTVDPCVNFYKHACGGWLKKNPIPPDQTSWSVYGKLYQDNLNFLRGILEQAAAAHSTDAVTQKIGDFYASCTDEAAIEKRGIGGIQAGLDAIAGLQTARGIAPLIARMQLHTAGYRSVLFAAGSDQDPDNSEQQITSLDQGGLGLPDRDYYTKDDAKSKEIRDRYVQHVQKVFELLGADAATAQKRAQNVMRMETALAKASLTRVERRDPYKLKNKMSPAELEKLAPNFDWKAYYATLGFPPFEILNATAPAFFKEVNRQLAEEPLASWKDYLRFHLADMSSAYLSSPFVQEGFEFYRKYLRGTPELQPRWKRCTQYTDQYLGEALGQAYVRKVFPPEVKQSTLDMVKRIEDAMALRIRELDWMSAETKQ